MAAVSLVCARLFFLLSILALEAEARQLKILTSFLPLYCFAANIAGDHGKVQNLLPAAASPHDYHLSPGDLRKIAEADLIIVNGLGMERWLDKIIASASPTRKKAVIEAFGGLDNELIRELPYVRLTRRRSQSHTHDSVANFHLWLDPRLACRAVSNIAHAFQAANPQHAKYYDNNAVRYVDKLEQLHEEMRAGLASFKGRSIVTYHDAFPYFARRYELAVIAVIEEMPGVKPSPRYLSALGSIIRTNNVSTIFTEKNSQSKSARQIATDLRVQIAPLDTLESGTASVTAYEDRMRDNLHVLQRSLK